MKKIFSLIIAIIAFVIFVNMTSAAVINGTCIDSDKGVNYNEKGESEGNWLTNRTEYLFVSDECKEDQKTLIEYYCDENFLYSIKHKCPNFCQDGSCVKELVAKEPVSVIEEVVKENATENVSIIANVSLNNSKEIEENISEKIENESDKNVSVQRTFIEVSEENAKDNTENQSKESFFKKIINWIKNLFSSKA
mgnify:CR=1 FL=1